MIIAVLLAVAVAMAFAFNRGRQDGGPPRRATGRPDPPARQRVAAKLAVARATTSTRWATTAENPAEVGNVIDGDPSTAWTTSTYFNNPALGGLKPGVGVMLDLGRDPDGDVGLDPVQGQPTDIEMYAAPAGVTQPPDALDQLERGRRERRRGTTPRSGSTTAPGRATSCVWLTKLPAGLGRLPRRDRRRHRPVVSREPGPGAEHGRETSSTRTWRAIPTRSATLFARHRDRLWAVALRTTGNPEDAADALQDAMISAFRRADSFRGDAAVTTWLHRIVVNACLDRLRRGRSAPPTPCPTTSRSTPPAATCWPGHGRPDPVAEVVAGERRRGGPRRPRPAAPGPEGGPGAGRHGGLSRGRGRGDPGDARPAP